MPRIYRCVLWAVISTLILPAQAQQPTGGGEYAPPRSACLTPAQHQRIDSTLAAGIRRLEQAHKLPASPARPTAVKLAWPLRQAAGFDYASYYGISNFVDHTADFPNQLLDWNCGKRTYDTNGGYNHAGLDVFLWPFDMNMMAAEQVDVVAAAPGVIVEKADGNFDRNCAMSNANWNAVYVRNADGSVCWYGHLKSGTLTAKPVGASVAQGEFLGKVGSSGSSTGPHLHFEVHDAAGKVVDPYAGTCSPGTSWWSSQKPYYESTLNTVLTHSAPPSFAACPTAHTPNEKSAFSAGELVYFAAYYHDQLAGQVGSYTVYRPDKSVFATWKHSMTAAHYTSSYWYWSFQLPADAPSGTWQFAVTFQGATVTRPFTVGTVSAATPGLSAPSIAAYPNPARRQLTIDVSSLPAFPRQATIRNGLGQVVATHTLSQPVTTVPLALASGVYTLVEAGRGTLSTQQLIIY